MPSEKKVKETKDKRPKEVVLLERAEKAFEHDKKMFMAIEQKIIELGEKRKEGLIRLTKLEGAIEYLTELNNSE